MVTRAFVLAFVVTVLALLGARHARAEDIASPSVQEAYELLRSADQLEGVHLGFAGVFSDQAAAFRVILADPSARTRFRALLAHGSTAGRLYALCGLFFTEPDAFPVELERMAEDDGSVRVMDGCIVTEEPIASVLRAPLRLFRIRVSKGQNLSNWQAEHPLGGRGDLAGGYYPLLLAGDAHVAPRDGI